VQPTERFSHRAGDYAKHRPGYPEALVDTLEREAGLAPGQDIVDIGAGTGISSLLFLRRGYRVTAVEPNAPMREQLCGLQEGYPDLHVVDGTAENTGLPAQSADLVLCAQAFHWVRAGPSKTEFERVVKRGGIIALVWNLRHRAGSPFREGLEALLRRHSPEYAARPGQGRVIEAAGVEVEDLFAPAEVTIREFPNAQRFDWDGLVGRMRSASYVPLAGNPEHEPFFRGLSALFDSTSVNGFVDIDYTCRLYWVRAGEPA
jgi:SAM-dependent methyltransferase